MLRTTYLVLAMLAAATLPAEEPKTLLARIFEWRYPDAKILESVMSDAATKDAQGKRTTPSGQCRTVMTTADSFAEVVAYYTAMLTPPDGGKQIEPAGAAFPRSVTYHSDSAERPVAIQIIQITTGTASTTLVISRAKGEAETHIAWTQYERL